MPCMRAMLPCVVVDIGRRRQHAPPALPSTARHGKQASSQPASSDAGLLDAVQCSQPEHCDMAYGHGRARDGATFARSLVVVPRAAVHLMNNPKLACT
jgi:hypothetical protein